MKNLSDKQFDELLKQKTESFDYDFDESAWDKMEHKLRKRDRIIFIRNSSLVLALMFLFGSAYFLNKDITSQNGTKLAKDLKTEEFKRIPQVNTITTPTEQLRDVNKPASLSKPAESLGIYTRKIKKLFPSDESKSLIKFSEYRSYETSEKKAATQMLANSSPIKDNLQALQTVTPLTVKYNNLEDSLKAQQSGENTLPSSPEVKSKPKRQTSGFSLTILAGPELSAVNSFAGSKGSLNVGVLFNALVASKVTLSAGVKYGLKNYAANAYNYNFSNPSRAQQVEGIDASCNILEIPLQLSYTIDNKANHPIKLSSGISSYLMLKEKYNFRYTNKSGLKDYLLVKNNANQHYLSVLNLSASYGLNSKSTKLKWEVEPYVKLPLGGVGEGNVRLKSSGISLNLTYDISKKIK